MSDKNTIKNFSVYLPTVAQFGAMQSIMRLARHKGERITLFAFAVHLGMSKTRLLCIAQGMHSAGFLTLANNRITTDMRQRHHWLVASGFIHSSDRKGFARSSESACKGIKRIHVPVALHKKGA